MSITLLRRMSLLVALRDMLQRRAAVVAIGVEADISSWAEFDDLVENDPERTKLPFVSNGSRS
jgi:hypothetical protein